ncbi:MAG: MarR family transcriptional regulator [Pseudomonadota bacterium]
MVDSERIARELDRVVRKIDAQMHRRMPAVDCGRIGPMGGLLLMQLQAIQPCPIQTLATAMGRDNSQLTRLIRDLESKGLLTREPSPSDGRATILSLTAEGTEFLKAAKSTLASVVDEVVAPLSQEERQTFVSLLGKI